MRPDLSEFVRTIPNLIRTGKIAEIRADKVRVRLSPSLMTTWLQWIALRAGAVVDWCPPSVDEQVTVLSPNGDLTQGKVLAGLFSADSPAPQTSLTIRSIHYPDGAVVLYDFGLHTLSAILPTGSSALVKADAVTADAKETTCTGNVMPSAPRADPSCSPLRPSPPMLRNKIADTAAHSVIWLRLIPSPPPNQVSASVA
ncbi:phage baseplate assembly protein V [Herbaspirillum seropedicae]|uniref:phage baseplate assembly protein V n=1 Tax=Herbaspirillum seropedicae TaxID=964 RepID=UPI003F8D0B4C